MTSMTSWARVSRSNTLATQMILHFNSVFTNVADFDSPKVVVCDSAEYQSLKSSPPQDISCGHNIGQDKHHKQNVRKCYSRQTTRRAIARRNNAIDRSTGRGVARINPNRRVRRQYIRKGPMFARCCVGLDTAGHVQRGEEVHSRYMHGRQATRRTTPHRITRARVCCTSVHYCLHMLDTIST